MEDKSSLMRKLVSAVIVAAFGLSGTLFAAESWDSLNAQVIQMYQKKYYTRAIPVAQRALDVAESDHGSDSPQTVLALNNLAMLYKKTKKYKAAGPLYLRALSVSEKLVGPDHPDLSVPLNNLAMYYETLKNYKKADAYSQRAIRLLETFYGPDHPNTQEARQRYDRMRGLRSAAA